MSNTLNGAIGGAMLDAVNGAMIGKAIGDARNAAADAQDLATFATQKANEWHDYARKLEVQVKNLKVALATTQAERDDALLKLAAKEKELAEAIKGFTKDEDNMASVLAANMEYGKQIKMRLIQAEKALQHSSADQESLRVLLEPYKHVVEQLNLDGSLPPDTKEKAEAAWNQFVSSGKLTSESHIQAILDQAPTPVRTKLALF